ncbi:MAG: CoA ester lyase [Solirubrobacterales bacterium]|nr:CoA ester lyase [Solirubrobacterales bacterium]
MAAATASGAIPVERVATLRSWMFVPTSPDRFIVKVPSLPVDAVMLDLEDGVLPSERPKGRENLRRVLPEWSATAVPFVRINGVDTGEWRDDAAAALGAAGVVLPKADSPAQVAELSAHLAEIERAAGLEVGVTTVVAAIESSAGLLAASRTAAADPRVRALLFGAEDYALDLGLPLVREGAGADLLDARSTIATAARSAGVLPIDGVHTEMKDEAGLREQSRLARSLGFSGKSLFHPSQIATINECFAPTDAEVAFAREVVAAFEEAARTSLQGAVAVGNHLVDLPIAERARRLLDAAEEFARRDG